MPKGVYPHTHIKPKRYPAEMVAQVRTLYESGMTQNEVATTLGVTQKVIWKLMRNHGIPTRPQVKRDQSGPSNAYWKGSAAGYQALHVRVAAARGKPCHCERCGEEGGSSRRYDWANLSGRYDDIGDYERMCRSCHRRFDRDRREQRRQEVVR